MHSTSCVLYLLDESFDAGDQEFELCTLVRRYLVTAGDEAAKAVSDGAGFVLQGDSISVSARGRACGVCTRRVREESVGAHSCDRPHSRDLRSAVPPAWAGTQEDGTSDPTDSSRT